jgi:hypothetical protein
MARTERWRHAVARLGRLLLASGSLTSVFAFSAEPTRPRELAPAATPAPAGRRPLDLRAPDVRRLLPAEQWRYPLPGEDDSVTVEARRNAPPPDPEKREVPGGIIAPFWALRHPSKAWRIFVPDPNAKAAAPPDPVPTLKSIQKQ